VSDKPAAKLEPNPLDLYVSSVEKAGPVTRFGMPPGSFIGAARSFTNAKQITYNEAEVVFIPGNERRRFLSEYDGAIASGSLIKRSQADYESWLEIEQKNEEAAEAARDKAKADAVAKAAEPAPTAEKEAITEPLLEQATEEEIRVGSAGPDAP